MDRLIKKIISMENPTALGLDTDFSYIPKDLCESFGEDGRDFSSITRTIFRYNCLLIDELCDIIPCAKVQIAYYEQYGPHGLTAFAKTVEYAKSKGMYVIADAKRNDIGATATAYANAFLGQTALSDGAEAAYECDSVTINGYLGTDGILPFTKLCGERDKSVFILVKTSNPSSGELQDLILSDGKKVYEHMGDMVARWGNGQMGTYGYSNVGAVVGATYPEQGAILRKRLPSVFFLIPGYGAQGATGKDLTGCFDAKGLGGVVNASRSLLCAYKKHGLPPAQAARKEALLMKEDITSALKQVNKWNI